MLPPPATPARRQRPARRTRVTRPWKFGSLRHGSAAGQPATRFARHEHTTPSSSSSKPSSCAAAHPAEWSITGTEPPTPDARRIHARPQGCQFRSGHAGGFIARVDRVFYAPAPAFGDHAGRVSKVAVNRIFASPATLVSRSPESSRNGRCRSSSTAVTS